MSLIRLLIFYVIVIGIGTIFIYLKVPTNYTIIFFAILAVAIVGYYAYTMTASKNTKAILRQIRSQKNNPTYAYVLAIKEGTKEEEIEALDRLINKYKKLAEGRLDYEFTRAARVGDLTEARKIIKSMKNGPLKTYNTAYVEALSGKYGIARDNTFVHPWMSHIIEGVIAQKQKNLDRYKSEMQLAVENSKGLQRLINQATFEKGLREWK